MFFLFFSACSHACHEGNGPAWAACRSSCAVCASKGCRQACFERLLQVCPAQPSEILLFNYLHSATQQAVHAGVFWTLQEVESQSWLSNNLSPQSGRPIKLILGREIMRMNCSVVAPQEVGRLRSSGGLFFFSHKYGVRRLSDKRFSSQGQEALFVVVVVVEL